MEQTHVDRLVLSQTASAINLVKLQSLQTFTTDSYRARYMLSLARPSVPPSHGWISQNFHRKVTPSL